MKVYVLLLFYEYDHGTKVLGIYTEPEPALNEANRLNKLDGQSNDLYLDGSRYVAYKEYSEWYEIQEHEVKGEM